MDPEFPMAVNSSSPILAMGTVTYFMSPSIYGGISRDSCAPSLTCPDHCPFCIFQLAGDTRFYLPFLPLRCEGPPPDGWNDKCSPKGTTKVLSLTFPVSISTFLFFSLLRIAVVQRTTQAMTSFFHLSVICCFLGWKLIFLQHSYCDSCMSHISQSGSTYGLLCSLELWLEILIPSVQFMNLFIFNHTLK